MELQLQVQVQLEVIGSSPFLSFCFCGVASLEPTGK